MLRLIVTSILLASAALPRVSTGDEYRIGRAKADITLPVWGIQMLGYVHPEQVGEGLRQRQYARTFVVADATDSARLAYATCEVAFVTHTVKLAVLEKLQQKFGNRYHHANLVLAGTHTHGTPGGYHHHLSMSVLGGDFFTQAFDALVDGITESVIAADADLRPGRIFLAQGEVRDASANRSAVAYRNNPAAEQAHYKSAVDTTMTTLKFVREDGVVGMLNWFAVHPTSVNFYYKLTTSDNKGYAAYLVEKAQAAQGVEHEGFVAAFANSNAGDATPNLNLDATGPGSSDLESCTIIGSRQAKAAMQLMDAAVEELHGPVDTRHAFVDFSQVVISAEFTDAGEQQTAPSAWGYAFAAGSDAEGGGNVLFKEGMTETDPKIDAIIRLVMPKVKLSPEFIESQKPKAILIASGLAKPTLHEQVMPVAVARIGQLVMVIGPAEYTTMSGRRFRAAVANEFGLDPRYVVVAGYANDFGGYVTTWHEYQLQQYEGGHTLFGPWSEAAYRQEFVRLARALKTQEPIESTNQPIDMRTLPHSKTKLDGPDERLPQGVELGDLVIEPKTHYAAGDVVSATFWTGSPNNAYDRRDRFVSIERLVSEPDTWEVVRDDDDWGTTAQWEQINLDGRPKPRTASRNNPLALSPPRYSTKPDPFQVVITWESSADTPPGVYRIVHFGRFKQDGQAQPFTARSARFEIGPQ